jgi:hypothetical protein
MVLHHIILVGGCEETEDIVLFPDQIWLAVVDVQLHIFLHTRMDYSTASIIPYRLNIYPQELFREKKEINKPRPVVLPNQNQK